MKTIERIKNQPIAGGGKVGDFVEIHPIHSCDELGKTPVETDMNFYCMEMCDTGDAYALAQLKAAYPGLDIKRVGRHLSHLKETWLLIGYDIQIIFKTFTLIFSDYVVVYLSLSCSSN